MIDYQNWLSDGVSFNALQARRNDAKAARVYAALKPLRTAAGRLAAAVRERWHAWRCEQLRKAGLREMRGLSDRLLDDIGLTRADLDALENGRAGDRSAASQVHRPVATDSARVPGQPQPSCELIELERVRADRTDRPHADTAWRPRGTHRAA